MQSTYPVPQYDDHHRPTTTVPIGGRFTFDHSASWFPGRTIRVEIEELQKADIGRKFARKDKRPLDPPPVVRLRAFEVYSTGTGTFEEEIRDDEYDELFAFGLLCYVDIFPSPVLDGRSTTHYSGPSGSVSDHHLSFQPDSGSSSPVHQLAAYPRIQPATSYRHGGPEAITTPGILPSYAPDYLNPLDFSIERRSEPWSVCPTGSVQTVVQHAGQVTFPEEIKPTELLAGATFVGCSLIEYNGSNTAMFAFSDLAVKMEGRYILRYRVFNVHGRIRGNAVPILAECHGGPFEIFSTKAFPGLKSSTELTKKLSIAGVRVNSRTKERQGWKRTRADDVYSDTLDPTEYGPTMTRGPRGLSINPADPEHPSHSHSQSFAGTFAYPPHSGPFVAGQPRTPPEALLEWARRNGELPRDAVPASAGNGDSYSTGTEDGDSLSSTNSLW